MVSKTMTHLEFLMTGSGLKLGENTEMVEICRRY